MVIRQGKPFYAGYHELMLHPLDAVEVLEKGHMVVNGRRVACELVGGWVQFRLTGLHGLGVESEPLCPAADNIQALPEAA